MGDEALEELHAAAAAAALVTYDALAPPDAAAAAWSPQGVCFPLIRNCVPCARHEARASMLCLKKRSERNSGSERMKGKDERQERHGVKDTATESKTARKAEKSKQ